MKISEAAAASGCHLETIRYYERIGLLPQAARRDNGYRTYGHEDVTRLRFITRGRELGFALDEIQSLLSLAERTDRPCDEVDALARKHLADIQERVQALNRIADELSRVVQACAGGARGTCAVLGDLLAAEARPPTKAPLVRAEGVQRRAPGRPRSVKDERS